MRRRFRDDEVLAREEDEAANHEDLVDERVDDAAERALDLPLAGEVPVEEIGEQRDAVDEERDVEIVRSPRPSCWYTASMAKNTAASTRRPAVRALGTWRNMRRRIVRTGRVWSNRPTGVRGIGRAPGQLPHDFQAPRPHACTSATRSYAWKSVTLTSTIRPACSPSLWTNVTESMSGAWSGCGRPSRPRRPGPRGGRRAPRSSGPSSAGLGERDLLLGEHQLFDARLLHIVRQLAAPSGPSGCRARGCRGTRPSCRSRSP